MPRILVLDDEPMIAMLVEDWLQELGYETIGPAQSVSAALSLLEGNDPDGAILDVSLGNDNCYAIADHLLARGIPFAFATGHGRTGIAARFQDVTVLPKPFDFVMMRRVLSELTAKTPAKAAASNTPLTAPPAAE